MRDDEPTVPSTPWISWSHPPFRNRTPAPTCLPTSGVLRCFLVESVSGVDPYSLRELKQNGHTSFFPTSPQETGQPSASSWIAEAELLIAAGADIAAVDAGVKSALAHAGQGSRAHS